MTLMTERIQDQLSAFVDDELSNEECAFFVRRLQRDPDATRRAMRFSVIGSALRGEMVQPDPGVLLRRIDAALDGTAADTGADRRRASSAASMWRPMLGVGISAGVAAVAVFLMRTVNMAGGEVEAGTAAAPVQTTQRVEPASYVVPQEPASNQMTASPIRLTNYLMHHGEYTSRLGRTIVNSNVVTNVDEGVDTETDAASADAGAAEASVVEDSSK